MQSFLLDAATIREKLNFIYVDELKQQIQA